MYNKKNEFTERGWSQLVEAVEQRNSTEGMSQLELVGEPTVYCEEESEEESGSDESDEESGDFDEESGESKEESGPDSWESRLDELDNESDYSDANNSMLKDTEL